MTVRSARRSAGIIEINTIRTAGVKDKPPTISETAFANSILEWAGRVGWRRFHVRNSGHGGRSYVQGDKGFPDLVLIKQAPSSPDRVRSFPTPAPVRMIVAELKVGKGQRGRARPEQQAWLDLLACFPGIEIYIWTPADWQTIIRLLGANV